MSPRGSAKYQFIFLVFTMSDPSPNAEDWGGGRDYGVLGKTALRKFLLGKILGM